MRIAVIGAGGIGGFYGAKLALAGNDVTFVARGAHLDAIRRNGLRVEHPDAPMHVADAKATDDPATIGPVDIAMCCTKLWDVEPAAPSFKPLVAGDGFFAIRMYAMRGEDGSVAADCRVNGQEFEEGKAALRRYVSTWPQAGFEFRKQYVVLQTLQSPATTPPAPAAT